MLVSFLGLMLGNVLLFTMSSRIEVSYNYYKWNEWGFTFSLLKLFGVIVLVVGWVAWFALAILIEHKLKINIIHRGGLDNDHLSARSDFLKIIIQKGPSSTDKTKSKD